MYENIVLLEHRKTSERHIKGVWKKKINEVKKMRR